MSFPFGGCDQGIEVSATHVSHFLALFRAVQPENSFHGKCVRHVLVDVEIAGGLARLPVESWTSGLIATSMTRACSYSRSSTTRYDLQKLIAPASTPSRSSRNRDVSQKRVIEPSPAQPIGSENPIAAGTQWRKRLCEHLRKGWLYPPSTRACRVRYRRSAGRHATGAGRSRHIQL